MFQWEEEGFNIKLNMLNEGSVEVVREQNETFTVFDAKII